ncbi:MAG: hypothetical protein K9H64_22705 [Bacteroidales bacterium]|nr:hypothetical protein [Bacteroidales bacterium]MCF8458850.1 hypothetical protein [Bacteroidales bacterium]
MKHLKLFTLISFCLIVLQSAGSTKIELSPYFKAGIFQGTIADAQQQVETALTSAGFQVIGKYQPEGNMGLSVVVFTSEEIKSTCLNVKDRGALAAALKVGFVAKGKQVEVSYINPEYLFNAYFMDEYVKYVEALAGISKKVKETLNLYSTPATAFGGKVELDDVREYQYMMGMEEFTDPVELNEFASFEEGLATITKNLAAQKGGTVKVYELVFESEKVAVFGIGLTDKKNGEAFFLPVIGEAHVAAMPYEIILQGTEATMLHGRYRIALHWPDLTMGTFTKIISTPGYIEDTMEALCK